MKVREYLTEASSIRSAFFISPYGDIIEAKISHIDTVIQNPEKFGLTKEYIQQAYSKHNEKVGQEGKAREEILQKLMEEGWIRIRRYNRFWSVNVNRITKKVKDYVYDWSKKILKGMFGFKERDKYMPVKIVPLHGNVTDIKYLPIRDIANDALYNESEKHVIRDMLTERNIRDILDVEQYILNEAGYSRLMRVLSGLVPSVKTFAIITWENPMNKPTNRTFNKKANERFKNILKDGHFSYRHIKGKYDNFENPFLILNISLKQAKHLGFEYGDFKQESIIYGKRFENKSNGEVGVIFKMIYSDNRPPQIRRVWKSTDSDNNYSEYKGRKFQIPFFDDEAKNYTFVDGKKKIIEKNYNSELVDSNGNVHIMENHKIYYAKYMSPKALQDINRMRDVLLDEYRSGRSLYENRGLMSLELEKRKHWC